MENMGGFLNKLKNLDAYPKINEDFYKRTLSGGIITAISGLVILLLFISETSEYFSVLFFFLPFAIRRLINGVIFHLFPLSWILFLLLASILVLICSL